MNDMGAGAAQGALVTAVGRLVRAPETDRSGRARLALKVPESPVVWDGSPARPARVDRVYRVRAPAGWSSRPPLGATLRVLGTISHPAFADRHGRRDFVIEVEAEEIEVLG